MRSSSIVLAGLVAVAAPSHAQAPVAPVPSPAVPSADALAVAYGARPAVRGMRLSPAGERALYLTPLPGDRSALMVADLATGAVKPVLTDRNNDLGLASCQWKSEERILCRTFAILPIDAVLAGFSRMFVINADGTGLRMLSERDSAMALGVRQGGGGVVHSLPDDPDHVLMSAVKVPEMSTGSRTAQTRQGLGVDRVNLRTGARTIVEGARPSASFYSADPSGAVRLMGAIPETASGYLGRQLRYFWKPEPGGQWTGFAATDLTENATVDVLGFDADGRRIFTLEPHQGRQALFLRDPASGARELVFAHPRVDIDGLLRIGKHDRPVAAVYALDATELHFFDPELKGLVERLSRALPGNPRVHVIDESWDGRKLLLVAEREAQPGRWFRFNRDTRELNELLAERPQLAGRPMGAVRAVSYRARDGAEVPGYLTLPPGRTDARGLPAIVMPQGGPSARDVYGFDFLAQYFAARGFVVLQPNFRGSAGYGAAWYVENGFKSWRLAVGDVNDGARWLAAQGADAARMAIFGWSYGGYAALLADTLDPGLFKAVVAVAPVTDLGRLKDEARDFSNYLLVKDFVGTGPHVAEGSPARQAGRIGPPVLLFHGDRDINVAIGHSRRMADALRDAGKRAELVVFPGLDHQLDDSAARAAMLARSTAWIEAAIGPVALPARVASR